MSEFDIFMKCRFCGGEEYEHSCCECGDDIIDRFECKAQKGLCQECNSLQENEDD